MENTVTEFPSELIAQYPSENRSDAKLMVVHRDTEKIEHRKFSDLYDYFSPGDVLAFNRSKIFNNILVGVKDNSKIKIEVTLLRELSKKERMWEILVTPARKIRIGNKIFFSDSGIVAEILDNTASRCRTIKFLNTFTDDQEFEEAISKIGIIKLPKYIKRDMEDADYQRMTAIYADSIGSLFPSVSGLHFDEAMWQQIEEKKLQKAFVTLHIGMSSINKINTKVLKRFKAGSEYCKVDKEDAEILTAAKKNENKICAVGVSTLKSLESSLNQFENNFQPLDQWVTKLIYDPYKIQSCDMLLTNFVETKTCQHICSAAFCGSKLLKKAYQEALKNNYQFLMYGDSLLIV